MKNKTRAAVAVVVVMLGIMIAVHCLVERKGSRPGNLGTHSNLASGTEAALVTGLVAAYSFNEGAGTTAADASGNENTGTIVNVVWTTRGKHGNALMFNGHDALVTIEDAASLQLTTGMTLEAWVNPFALPPATCIPTSTCYWMDVIHKDSDRYYIEASSNQNGEPEAGGIFVRPWTLLHFHTRFGKHALYVSAAIRHRVNSLTELLMRCVFTTWR